MPKKSKTEAPMLPHLGVSKSDVTHDVIARFQSMLREGRFRHGDRLPPERELAMQFNIARSSLRQALKVLEILGVITQRIGDGSYLASDASAILSVPLEFLYLLDDTSAEELAELRFLIEPGLARLAAQRAEKSDLDLLRKSVQDLANSSGDRLALVSADLLFHRAIFQASKNHLASNLFHHIHRSMAKMILVTSQLVELEHTLSFHLPILKAIEQRDAEQASQLMQDHIHDAHHLLLTKSPLRRKEPRNTAKRKLSA